ncbi:hypothetical protein [Lacticaseibacillus saniviri]|uniref:Uncharacterized protein n=1 Tax=Lacticaseibacillus saniviri JCM 17471 = DSM 24301 TaxID=1293598 RepID=A0A0R2MSZ6_9LACO|nr:hypothetical protein [Lacticaseibacillus saniviri]KRO16702.1 hypothetical protein IV56_GL000976 [Lacticaseibacillus saniviri JCM 17471 = DSM 24301]MCG4281777.1 hypothetical protein [Lacticaseibacillus saniviri]
MTQDYAALLDQLRDGSIDSLEVQPEEFMAFRAVWTNYAARKEIVGTAQRSGVIIYRYQSNESG